MKEIYLPHPEEFGLTKTQCLEIENTIRHGHAGYAPVRLPPPIIKAPFKETLIEESIFLTQMIFSVVDNVFAGNHQKLAEHLKIDQCLGDLLPKLAKPEWQNRAKKFYRPDFLLTESGLRMVENNIDTPLGGIGLCDVVINKFQKAAGITSEFLQKNGIYSISLDAQWAATLNKLLRKKKSPSQEKPVFFSAYHSENVRPDEDFTTVDYNLTVIQNGFTLLAGPISQLTIKNNKVTFNGTEIDIVYTDFGYTEYLENNNSHEIIDKLINLDEKGGVLFLSPPASMLFDNKSILSFLTEDCYRDCFRPDEWKRLQRLIPETRIVNTHTREYCIKNREELVLKPGFDFGGKNVFFGSEQDESTWIAMIDKATLSVFPTVVQHIVRNQIKAYDKENDVYLHFCIGPLFFDDIFAGCLYRESNEPDAKYPIINATRGSRFSSTYYAT